MMERVILPGQTYRHFKGNTYRILCIAMHTETGEDMVIYQGQYGDNPVFARPKAMFLELVDREKYPDMEQKYRFELV